MPRQPCGDAARSLAVMRSQPQPPATPAASGSSTEASAPGTVRRTSPVSTLPGPTSTKRRTPRLARGRSKAPASERGRSARRRARQRCRCRTVAPSARETRVASAAPAEGSASASRKRADRGAHRGEWKAPATGRRHRAGSALARRPRAVPRSLREPESTCCPGALSFATTTPARSAIPRPARHRRAAPASFRLGSRASSIKRPRSQASRRPSSGSSARPRRAR